MSHETAPEDRIAFSHKLAYGAGGFVNNLLASAITGIQGIILPITLGMDLRVVGLLGMLPRATDALTDPLMGFVSDNTRTRWGRRRPYLLVGAIFTGIVFIVMWQAPAPTQFRLKLVDYGADGVYSGVHKASPPPASQEEGAEAVDGRSMTVDGRAMAAAGGSNVAVDLEIMDDVEHEVIITPPTLASGRWVGIDVPLSDFTDLVTRDHLAQILISGDLENIYLDNLYLYRAEDPPPTVAVPSSGPETASVRPTSPAPAPTIAEENVISFLSRAYDDVPVGFWSTDWDEAEYSDDLVDGVPMKRYYNLRFAGIDFGEQTLDVTAMTHIHVDIWTPDPVGEGWSQAGYFRYFLIISVIFFLGYTVFATPWVALGYELTPDYNERTRLMGVQNFIANFAFLAGPWFAIIMFSPALFRNPMDGARTLGWAIGIATIGLGIIPALVLRERKELTAAPREQKSLGTNGMEFLQGLWMTLTSGPFLLLCTATFLIFNSFIMISTFQFWIFVYYVSGGNQIEGSWLAGIVGTVGLVAGFLIIVLVTWMGTKIGKRRAFFVSTGVSMIGYALKWFCYHPDYPMLALLPAPFLAFGLSGLFTLMGSMIADVVDLDELSSGQRREGMFGSIYWWVVKVGQAVAIFAGGFMLHATGFDPALGGAQPEGAFAKMRLIDAFVPFVASGLAIWAVAKFPITEKMSVQIRAQLQKARSAQAAAPA